MKARVPVERFLQAAELRSGFLRYTREAFALLPALDQPRILDVGCGSGAATLELARLSGGAIVGIDTSLSALVEMRRRVVEAGLAHRVTAINVSLLDTAFAEDAFDVLWEEGVLHLLDPVQSVPACSRLLKRGGYLVMHETVTWFEGNRKQLAACGFRIHERLLLPQRCWWTDYYAPLEARIRALRAEHGDGIASEELVQHEREIALVRAAPDRFDSAFFILRIETEGDCTPELPA